MTDADIRREALDPARSFIVQAPAGSGKTELLIQRYLTLLGRVDDPEQIIAITFTRKAAGEMRQRVLRALTAAAERRAAASDHEAATLELARAVLDHGEARGWSLPEHPRRMRIETLDALNGRLASQLPTLAGGVGGARVSEDASAQYRQAAARTVDELLAGAALAAPLRRLLRCFDYSLARVEQLIAQLLPKREQWLKYLGTPDESRLRRALEEALTRLVAEELERAAKRLPAFVCAELPALLAHAASHSDVAELAAAGDHEVLELDRLATWRAIAELLLTRQDEWRRKVNRRLGFGPAHHEARARLTRLLERCAADDALRETLARLRRLPEPRYSDEQWRMLADLRAVLRRAAAELRVVFAETRSVDFVELSIAAQAALGAEDAPSDLLLALDYAVRHILVDEFQDTSHGQLRLLEILTAGWEPGDGRTLFLVGDPMQSIYRFRDADMSLFLKVRADGLGDVPCEPLTLRRNFRSAPRIIEWINETFARTFPSADDIGRGEVRFAPCDAVRDDVGDAGVRVHASRDDDERRDVETALAIIERERDEHPERSIAVLVQSRAHLGGLHERLRARGVPVNAVEIDPLAEHQVVQDLVGLTRALLHPADRIAWLGVLRAPWCGLRWADLEALCGGERERTIGSLIADPAALARLDDEARERVEPIAERLRGVLATRAEHVLVDWIEHAWIALDGPGCIDSPADQHRVEQFFATLGELARRGDLDDPAALDAAFAAPRAEPQPDEAGVEIMTIHRAKGLEFDTVVLLGLGRETRREARRALYWMERVAADGREDLLMAPPAPPGRHDRLVALLRDGDEQRERAERTRLLYVAATRAKARLHLVCRLPAEAPTPPARSLLAPLWPIVGGRFPAEPDAAGPVTPDGAITPVLLRFADGPAGPPAPPAKPARTAPRPEFDWAGLAAMQVGTLVHRRLQQIAQTGLDAWSRAELEASRGELRRELELLGLERGEVEGAAEQVVRALVAVVTDPIGRWILGPHREAASEAELTLHRGGDLEHLRIDRTFVAESGTRWIVDFKTGTHEGADLDAFLDAEVERYRAQLERYAAAMAGIDDRPIRLGLYFPLLGAFRGWAWSAGWSGYSG